MSFCSRILAVLAAVSVMAVAPMVGSMAQPNDGVSARIGDKDWSASEAGLIGMELGKVFLVQTTPSVQPGDTHLSFLKLQFDAKSLQEQALTRDCGFDSPCIEFLRGDDQFRIDGASKQPAVLKIIRADGGAVEGTFSADLESKGGKTTIRDGRFKVTLKP